MKLVSFHMNLLLRHEPQIQPYVYYMWFHLPEFTWVFFVWFSIARVSTFNWYSFDWISGRSLGACSLCVFRLLNSFIGWWRHKSLLKNWSHLLQSNMRKGRESWNWKQMKGRLCWWEMVAWCYLVGRILLYWKLALRLILWT